MVRLELPFKRLNMKKSLCFLAATLFISALFAQTPKLKIGQPAPAISLPAPNGKTITLASFKGKLVLIDFWATWCAPCMEEQPELKALYEKHNAQVKAGKFEIFGVSLDKNKENWEKTIKRFNIPWPQASDLLYWKSAVAKDYALEGLPFNVLVNERGNIVALNLHGNALEVFVNNYLKGM